MLTWCMEHYYLTAAIAIFIIYLIEVTSHNVCILIEQGMRIRMVKTLLNDNRVDLTDIINELKR